VISPLSRSNIDFYVGRLTNFCDFSIL